MSVRFLTDLQIENRALTHRRELGFRDGQSIDFMTLITKLKSRYDKFDYKRVPDGSLGEAEAQWDSEKKLILIPESAFRAANNSDPRAMFTVVHEVGHALLGHKGILNRGPAGNNVERISASVRSLEYQARRYAAAFLVPYTEITRLMDAIELAKVYRVSRSVAEQRTKEIASIKI